MCSVPQGSVLGPFQFILYMPDLADIAIHSTTCHYVRLLMTIRLYNHCQPENAQSAVISVQRCVSATEQWMAASRLILNVDNTELMWTGIMFNLTKVPVCGFSVTLGSAYVTTSDAVLVLGVLLTPDLSLDKHVIAVSAKCVSSYDNCGASDVLSTTTQ